MKTPKILYKYMKSCDAQALLKMGVFRVGTLYDYRTNEHGAKITDINEAILNPRTHVENEMWRPETRPDLRKFINIRPGADVTVRNSDFESRIQSTNCYLYCLSDKFCTELYNDFDADICIAINDPKRFLKKLSETIHSYIYPKDGVLSHVQYVNRKATHRELEHHHPALTKDLNFQNQAEWRYLWQPIAKKPKPIIIANYRIIKFCRLHHVK